MSNLREELDTAIKRAKARLRAETAEKAVRQAGDVQGAAELLDVDPATVWRWRKGTTTNLDDAVNLGFGGVSAGQGGGLLSAVLDN